jgi:SAM-dependent methyltransferase
MQRIRENRQRINRDLADADRRKLFSPVEYAFYRVMAPALSEYARGKVIDVGCGDMPYKSVIVAHATEYDTIDVERRVPEVKFVGDVHDMKVLADETYDSAVCLDVLEHVHDPLRALGEIRRVLKRDGRLLLSVPHLSRLHEEPHDYFRYTKYGLSSLFDRAGFEVLSIVPSGGLFCFLGHQVSVAVLGSVWHLAGVKQLAFFLNQWLCVRPCFALDELLDPNKLFAQSYVAIATKR